ncbi:MAG: hypothetical protein R2722_04285 [Tessaracoccus sp.]
MAWAFQRPGKKPADLKNEQWWRQELRDAGYHPDQLQHRDTVAPVSLDELSVQQVASRADPPRGGCIDVETAHRARARHPDHHRGRRASHARQFREFIDLATHLAASD